MSAEENIAHAVVRSLEADMVEVEIEQGCGRCHEEGGCGGQNLTQMFAAGPRHYRLRNTVGAGIGDRVAIAIAPGSVRRSANFAYGVPLAALFVGALAGGQLAGDNGAMLGAAAGLLLAFLYLAWCRPAASQVAAPQIVSRLPTKSGSCSR
jgi:sigma-E factor negative regulatory protein RseC